MIYKQIVGLVGFLLFALSHKLVSSDCTFDLKDLRNIPLIIYKYQSDGIPIIHYPDVDTNCLAKGESEAQYIHLACPGLGRITKSSEARSVYLLNNVNEAFSNSAKGGFTTSDIDDGPCFDNIVPKMIKTDSLRPGPKSLLWKDTYAVGFRLNELDVVNTYSFAAFLEDEGVIMHIRIPAVIRRAQYLRDKNVNNYDYSIDKYRKFKEYKVGLTYQNKKLNFTELYSPEYQKATFQKHFENLELTEKYFSERNSLVVGQLILEQDMFYVVEQISTFFYENTVPMWKSVYEGNWNTIGNIIRRVADESARDLEVFVSTIGSFNIINATVEKTWALSNSTNSPDGLAIPYLLVKAAVDVKNRHRALIFHTFNDPYLDPQKANIKKYCSETTDCAELNPEFLDVKKGYTFCCRSMDSYLFNNLIQWERIEI